MGGNKSRQLEFYLGEAKAQDADVVLITGAVQSNFVRLAAACARKLGMDIHIQLEQRVSKPDALYANSGNVLLDKLLGATLHHYPHGEDEVGADKNLERIAARLRTQGKHPYVIHLAPGHKPLGALGYLVAAKETLAQINDRQLTIDEFVVPSGSGATHAGFLFGLRALGNHAPVTGICVRRDAVAQASRIRARCNEIAALLEMPTPVTDADVVVTDAYLAPGYGKLNSPTRAAIVDAARTEGLLLDPVYSGKTLAGALAIAHQYSEHKNILFLHTGGTPAIFAYGDDLLAENNR
jgi:D-cysteine desulfhydrase/L-cysteate sulfo-lyase